MKQVLVIGYVWPEPNSSAAGSHMMSLLRIYRKKGWKVEFATPAQKTDHMHDLNSEGITSKEIKLNCTSFDTYVTQLKPDIVMFDRFMMEEQFGWRIDKYCPNALKILDTEDLQCLRNARHLAHKQNRELTTDDLFSDLAKREVAAIYRCDISLIISSFEKTLLIEKFKVNTNLLYHLPFMVNAEQLSKRTKPYLNRNNFVTIGNFRHAPNWDAVLQLQKIWPMIRKALPQAELHIYGSYPPPKATALNNPKTGFLIKGWAKNAQEVIEGAKICLAPLKFGAGIKGKLLDACLAGTPSITTSIGSEGMLPQTLDWPGEIHDDLNKFALAAIKLYQNKADWLNAHNKCQRLLSEQFDMEKLEAPLLNIITVTLNNLTQHRSNNFTGAMLKHHSMASTKYMSQWIEAKNK